MNKKEHQLRWIKQLSSAFGLSTTQLARRAGLQPSTLNRPMNDVDYTGLLSDQTINRIAEEFSLAPYEAPRNGAQFRLEEVLEPTPKLDVGTAKIVNLYLKETDKRFVVVSPSHLLNSLGILAGDLCIIDMSGKPQRGEIVCACVPDPAMRHPAKLLRVFQPPYLLTACQTAVPLPPIVVDDSTIKIIGPVVNVIRSTRK